jgi:hypothetical protein
MAGAPLKPTPQVGQRVKVDLSGMEVPGGSVAPGTIVTGTVTNVNPDTTQLTIRLDISVGGHGLVTALPIHIHAVI